jgi:hypothetical protein
MIILILNRDGLFIIDRNSYDLNDYEEKGVTFAYFSGDSRPPLQRGQKLLCKPFHSKPQFQQDFITFLFENFLPIMDARRDSVTLLMVILP